MNNFVVINKREPGHGLRRDDGHILGKALEFEVRGKRK